MPASRRAITSRVTVQNPRPRKYASAAEKQAAFRARFPTLCVRVEPKTADTVQAVADASGRTQQETLLSMLKYAMTNRNWLTLGLTEHKQLPRIEEPRKENPTMKRKPTPAQIAARERFAAMARSGAFKKKATKAKKAKAAPKRNPITETLIYGLAPGETRDYMEDLLYDGGLKLTPEQIDKVLKAASAAGYHSFRIAGFDPTVKPDFTKALKTGRKRNPRASNPIKRKGNPMIKYALVPDDGGFTYGMDDRTPVQFVFSSRDRTRGIYRSFELPSAVTSNPEFQRFASSLPGKSIIASLADLRKMMKQYI